MNTTKIKPSYSKKHNLKILGFRKIKPPPPENNNPLLQQHDNIGKEMPVLTSAEAIGLYDTIAENSFIRGRMAGGIS